MIAVIEKASNGYTARFERYFNHSPEQVWAMLTDNKKLAQWFPELSVDELRKGGFITFDMGGGSFEKMEITELQQVSILEFTWADDLVRFELYSEQERCRLVMIETLLKLTDHTPRDLAGWHVCLEVIQALLDERTLPSRKEEWQEWYEKYVQAIADVLK